MDLELLRRVLLYCTIANYAILLVWFFAFTVSREFLYRLHSRWFRLTPERFDSLHYAGMALYKLGIVLLNLVPWLALTLATGA